jgi:hypothetical protein
MKQSKKRVTANGFVLHEDKRNKIVVIATGFIDSSVNVKTGAMIQVWILRTDVSPVEAIKQGLDESICFQCPARGSAALKLDIEEPWKRFCYVNVGQAPLAVWKAYQAGNYPRLTSGGYWVFQDREVRWGAYGDTCLIPEPVFARVARVARAWTGYSHQWKQARYAWLARYVMASCDTAAEQVEATRLGWRTFRVTEIQQAMEGEINCPSSDESENKTQCLRCKLCAGTSKQAKNIFIKAHGPAAKQFAIFQRWANPVVVSPFTILN